MGHYEFFIASANVIVMLYTNLSYNTVDRQQAKIGLLQRVTTVLTLATIVRPFTLHRLHQQFLSQAFCFPQSLNTSRTPESENRGNKRT